MNPYSNPNYEPYPQRQPTGGFQPYPMDWNAPPPKRGFQWMPSTSGERWKYAGVALAANAVLQILGMAMTGAPIGVAAIGAVSPIGLPLGPVVWVYGIAAVVAWRREKAASAPNYDYGFGVPPQQAGAYQPYPPQMPQQPVYDYPSQFQHPVAPQQPAPSADPVADIMSRLQGLSEEDAQRLNRLIDGDTSGS